MKTQLLSLFSVLLLFITLLQEAFSVTLRTSTSNHLATQGVDTAGLARACITSFSEAIPPDFCWKKGGDAGVIPTDCPQGYFRVNAWCRENCRDGYHFVAGVCWQNCPAGYATWPLRCRKSIRDQFYKSSYVPGIITNFDDQVKCPYGRYRPSGSALCYKNCNDIGMENCGIGACASTKAMCGSTIAQMVFDTLVGLADAVTTVLSFGATIPAKAAAKSTAKTALKEIGQSALQAAVKSLKEKLTGSFAKSIKDQALKKAKDLAKNYVSNVAQAAAEEYVKSFCGPIYEGLVTRATTSTGVINADTVVASLDVLGISDMVSECKTKDNGLGCATAVVKGFSALDPTGLLTIAGTFMKPTCDVVPAISEQEIAKKAQETIDILMKTIQEQADLYCAQLYEHCNYQGNMKRICSNTQDLAEFRSKTSSLKIGTKMTVSLFNGILYTGQAYPIASGVNIPCLDTAEYQSEDFQLNDNINSIAVNVDDCMTLIVHLNAPILASMGVKDYFNSFLCKTEASKNDIEFNALPSAVLDMHIAYSGTDIYQVILYQGLLYSGNRIVLDPKSPNIDYSKLPFKKVYSAKVLRRSIPSVTIDGYNGYENADSASGDIRGVSKAEAGSDVLAYLRQRCNDDDNCVAFAHTPNQANVGWLKNAIKKDIDWDIRSPDDPCTLYIRQNIPGYRKIDNKDSTFDLKDVHSKNLQDIKNACNADVRCRGFNTLGILKESIPSQGSLSQINTNGFALYVKEEIPGYFFSKKDSDSNDIKNVKSDAVAEIKRNCDDDLNCLGFNTEGWLKNLVQPKSKLAAKPAGFGFYAKYPQLEGYVFVASVDSIGNDLGKSQYTNLKAYKTDCDSRANCVGFTSEGWLKSAIKIRAELVSKTTDDMTYGTFIKISNKEAVPGYEFIPKKDSDGNDIFNLGSNYLEDLRKACDSYKECVGFNTDGWLKTIIKSPELMVTMDRQNYGTWRKLPTSQTLADFQTQVERQAIAQAK